LAYCRRRLNGAFQERLVFFSMISRLRAHILCAFLSAIPVTAIPVFQVVPVGPSGFPSSATAINATGAVVGNYLQPDGSYRAFLWRDGQSTELTMPAEAVQTWASAISGSAQAGGYSDSLSNAYGTIWNSSGTPLSTPGAYVMGMNAAGDAAGMAIGGDGAGYAFVTRNGAITSLGQPGGGSWSTANAINDSGAAAGTAMTAAGRFSAFSATPAGVTNLLAGLGGANSYAKAINASGAVAGHAQLASGAMRATVWTDGLVVNLGSLGGVNSFAYAINSLGQVAGYADLPGGAGTAAFLYSEGTLYNLNGLIGAGSGWDLLAAYGMNDAGQIVGKGLYNGQEQAFLLTPALAAVNAVVPTTGVPEPSTLWFAGPPILAYFAIRVRHRRLRVRRGR
jgi:probable HAF family extracellular repeat protein